LNISFYANQHYLKVSVGAAWKELCAVCVKNEKNKQSEKLANLPMFVSVARNLFFPYLFLTTLALEYMAENGREHFNHPSSITFQKWRAL
jgi:hypothetical protein